MAQSRGSRTHEISTSANGMDDSLPRAQPQVQEAYEKSHYRETIQSRCGVRQPTWGQDCALLPHLRLLRALTHTAPALELTKTCSGDKTVRQAKSNEQHDTASYALQIQCSLSIAPTRSTGSGRVKSGQIGSFISHDEAR